MMQHPAKNKLKSKDLDQSTDEQTKKNGEDVERSDVQYWQNIIQQRRKYAAD